MVTRSNVKEYHAKEIVLEKASNGWIVSAKYEGLYDTPPSIIAPTIEEALAAAKGLANKPFKRSDDY